MDLLCKPHGKQTESALGAGHVVPDEGVSEGGVFELTEGPRRRPGDCLELCGHICPIASPCLGRLGRICSPLSPIRTCATIWSTRKVTR